ncbi:MAG TPA: hypothetical protein VHA52_04405 [Candidatus Babeliaceae bacterium]|nr:hypothetical protein [Candidatus Babeliaceae bacterium]
MSISKNSPIFFIVILAASIFNINKLQPAKPNENESTIISILKYLPFGALDRYLRSISPWNKNSASQIVQDMATNSGSKLDKTDEQVVTSSLLGSPLSTAGSKTYETPSPGASKVSNNISSPESKVYKTGSAALNLAKAGFAIPLAILNVMWSALSAGGKGVLKLVGLMKEPPPEQLLAVVNRTGIPLELTTIIPCQDESGRFVSQKYPVGIEQNIQLLKITSWATEPHDDPLIDQHLAHCFPGYIKGEVPLPTSWQIQAAPSFCGQETCLWPAPLALDSNQVQSLRLYAEQKNIIPAPPPPATWSETLNPGLLVGKLLSTIAKPVKYYASYLVHTMFTPLAQYIPSYVITFQNGALRAHIEAVPYYYFEAVEQPTIL